MLDFHSHILPGVDDGSKSVDESLALLQLLREQGIETVVATPHFYAEFESVERFIKRRDHSYEKLSARLPSNSPKIICGAEVYYYPGISKMPELEKLCIGDTKLLMLEMPFAAWSEYTVRELVGLASSGKYTVVIAHIERYMGFQKEDTIRTLVYSGVLMQSNADFFLNFKEKRKAISMMRRGLIHFLGSDCHNLEARPPKIGAAYKVIEKKMKKELLIDLYKFWLRKLNLE